MSPGFSPPLRSPDPARDGSDGGCWRRRVIVGPGTPPEAQVSDPRWAADPQPSPRARGTSPGPPLGQAPAPGSRENPPLPALARPTPHRRKPSPVHETEVSPVLGDCTPSLLASLAAGDDSDLDTSNKIRLPWSTLVGDTNPEADLGSESTHEKSRTINAAPLRLQFLRIICRS